MDMLDEIEERLAAVRERVAEDHENLRRRPTLLLNVTQNDRQVLARHLTALVAFAREIEARHRPVHPDWVRPGDRICEECTDAAAYAAGVSYVAWPCPTAAAVQKLGGA